MRANKHRADPIPDPQDFRFDAFVSYTRSDATFARALQRDLEANFGSLTKQVRGRKKRLTIFRDETDLTSSGDLMPALLDRIRESRKLLVICSPTSRSAAWVNKEIESYRTIHGTTGNEGIVAVLLAGEDPVKDTVIPVTLTEQGREPLAVEFRREKIEPAQNYQKYARGDGLLRVLAPLLDLDYPDLKNRHQEYEKRRLRRNMIVAGVLAVVFAALSIVTFLFYQEADRQKGLALGNLNDALMGYAIAVRLEMQKGDLDRADGDFGYMLRLGQSLPFEPPFALLWATFAEDSLNLGKAFSAAGQFDRAEANYKVSMHILDNLIQSARRKSGNKEWSKFAEERVEMFGRPGEVFVLTPSGSAATVMDQWRERLKEVTRRLEELPSTSKR